MDLTTASAVSAATQSDIQLLLATTLYAANAHRDQRRKDPKLSPYINHTIEVASRIAGVGSSIGPTPDVWILQAALLHDTVEDTETTLEDLEKAFGKRVAKIVDECSDDPHLDKAGRKQAQIDHAPHISEDAKHVKLSDKLSNLHSIIEAPPTGWTPQRIQEYFVWAKRVSDGCKDANPGLGDQLEELYKSATFTLQGKTYKCHPDYK